MFDLLITVIFILMIVVGTMQKSGQLDELREQMSRKRQNKADNVVYEQTDAPPKQPKRKQPPRMAAGAGKAAGGVLVLIVVCILALGSVYTLSEEEMAVVTTFGSPSVQEASGLHFKLPFVQRVTKVSKAITGMQIGYTTDPERAYGASADTPVSIENESLMITNDFNLINDLL